MNTTQLDKTKIISFRANLKITSDLKQLAYTLGMTQTDLLKLALRRIKHDFENGVKL